MVGMSTTTISATEFIQTYEENSKLNDIENYTENIFEYSNEYCDIDDYADDAVPYENYVSDDEFIEYVPEYSILTSDDIVDESSISILSSSTNVLSEGNTLNSGESIINGNYKAIMQSDGNFVVYNGSTPLYSTGTSGTNCYAKMQTDGNFVIYSSSGTALWATKTNVYGSSHKYSLVLSSSGELNVKDNTSSYYIWSTKSSISNCNLTTGHCISSPNRTYMGIMQSDGNFVVYKLESGTKTAVWSTGTGGNPNAFLRIQADGNIVVYNSSSSAIYSTGTNHGLAYNYVFSLLNNGYVQLKKNNTNVIWISLKTVSLNVNSICQLDYTGTYDGTHVVSKSGCFVTSIAMVENFETFSSYTPYNIKNIGITFDSGGGYISIPSTYTDINYGMNTLTSTILSSIYKELKKGHPVIISRCNSSGNQHFVVIKGYTGDGISYSANQFVVNDPGSSKTPVTTLDQIFTSGYGVRHIIYRD